MNQDFVDLLRAFSDVDVIGLDAFVTNKRATGRARDLGDIEALGDMAVKPPNGSRS